MVLAILIWNCLIQKAVSKETAPVNNLSCYFCDVAFLQQFSPLLNFCKRHGLFMQFINARDITCSGYEVALYGG